MPHITVPIASLPRHAVRPGLDFNDIGRLDEFNMVEAWVCGAIKRAVGVPYRREVGPLDQEMAIATEPIKSVLMTAGASYGIIRNGHAIVLPLDIRKPAEWRNSRSIVRAIHAGTLTNESLGFNVLYACSVRARSAHAGTIVQEAIYTPRSFSEQTPLVPSSFRSGAVLRGLTKAVVSTDIEAVVQRRLAESRRLGRRLLGGNVRNPASGGLPGSSRDPHHRS